MSRTACCSWALISEARPPGAKWRRCATPSGRCQGSLRDAATVDAARSASTRTGPSSSGDFFLAEQTVAVSLLDRILHHANVVVTSGESYRMREPRTRGKGVTEQLERSPEEWELFLAVSGYFYVAMDNGAAQSRPSRRRAASMPARAHPRLRGLPSGAILNKWPRGSDRGVRLSCRWSHS